jgi:hypothetical protein
VRPGFRECPLVCVAPAAAASATASTAPASAVTAAAAVAAARRTRHRDGQWHVVGIRGARLVAAVTAAVALGLGIERSLRGARQGTLRRTGLCVGLFLLCHGDHLGLCFAFVLCNCPCEQEQAWKSAQAGAPSLFQL